MAIFNCYVSSPEGSTKFIPIFSEFQSRKFAASPGRPQIKSSKSFAVHREKAGPTAIPLVILLVRQGSSNGCFTSGERGPSIGELDLQDTLLTWPNDDVYIYSAYIYICVSIMWLRNSWQLPQCSPIECQIYSWFPTVHQGAEQR